MRVMVAGATGAIGRRLVPMLVGEGHEVTGITRHASKQAELAKLGARAVVADAKDAAAVRQAVRQAQPDAIVNQLTDLPQRLNPRQLGRIYAANNDVRHQGYRNILAAAKASGVHRVVLQSSAYWYQPGPNPASETEPLYTHAPEPIGEAVRTMSRLEREHLESDIEACVLRYGMFYGPGTWYSPEGDVGQQIRRRKYPIIGRGEGSVSFVHVDDAARATMAALTAPPGVYNVVDDEPAPNGEWPNAFAQALGAKPPRRVPVWLARLAAGPALVEWLTHARPASNRLARQRLRWEPEYRSWRTGFQAAFDEWDQAPVKVLAA